MFNDLLAMGAGGGGDLNNLDFKIVTVTIQVTNGVYEHTFDTPVYLLMGALYRRTSITVVPIVQMFGEDGVTPISEELTMTLNAEIDFYNNNPSAPLRKFYFKQTNGASSWASSGSKIYFLQPKN